MGDFFRGWRRKIGVVTLAMGLMFTGAWTRSLFISDTITLPMTLHSCHAFISVQGSVGCWIWHFDEARVGSVWPVWHTDNKTFEDWTMKQKWQSCGFIRIGSEIENGIGGQGWLIPYWCVVITLTLLSAFLLLTKPADRIKSILLDPFQSDFFQRVNGSDLKY